MPTLLLATANPHKVEELKAILAEFPLDIISLSDLPTPTREPAETGHTFVDNATIKALSYARQTGHLCLADDSGLEIDALRGRPGVISSHYSTDGRETGLSRAERDQANNQRVLRELTDVPLEQRAARFVCVIVIASPNSPIPLHISRGTFEGRIGETPHVPRGSNGFGYDPLFLVAPEFTHTSAELSSERKNALSHRGHAARDLAYWLLSGGISQLTPRVS